MEKTSYTPLQTAFYVALGCALCVALYFMTQCSALMEYGQPHF